MRLYRAEWSTNCERVVLALAHKGVEVESVIVDYLDRSAVERVSGQSLVPVIVDGDEVVSDSIPILRYLEARFPEPRLFPTGPARRAEMDVFLDWFERVWKTAPDEIEDELERDTPDRDRVDALGATIRSRLDIFEAMLASRDFLMGDELSAADCAAFPFLRYARGRDPRDDHPFHLVLEGYQSIGDGHPRLADWIERVTRD